jgi:hypothetical protein
LQNFLTETAEGIDGKRTKEVLAWQIEVQVLLLLLSFASHRPGNARCRWEVALTKDAEARCVPNQTLSFGLWA